MNKRKKELQRQEGLRRRKKKIVLLLGILLSVGGLILLVTQRKSPDRKAWDESTEGRLLQSAATSPIHPKYRPVLIYRYRGNNRPAFTAVGTQFDGTNGTVIATVEHLLVKKFEHEWFVLRLLSPDEHQVTNGLTSIVSRNIGVGLPRDTDVVFLRPGDPAHLECFSKKSESIPESAQVYFFDNVQVGGRTVKSLRSLITGKEYKVIGASKAPQFILLSYSSQAGESGSGFVDEYGQLYVLSGGTRSGTNPISFLSGPFADLGKRL